MLLIFLEKSKFGEDEEDTRRSKKRGNSDASILSTAKVVTYCAAVHKKVFWFVFGGDVVGYGCDLIEYFMILLILMSLVSTASYVLVLLVFTLYCHRKLALFEFKDEFLCYWISAIKEERKQLYMLSTARGRFNTAGLFDNNTVTYMLMLPKWKVYYCRVLCNLMLSRLNLMLPVQVNAVEVPGLAKVKTVNGERTDTSPSRKEKGFSSETSIRSDLKLDDAEGTNYSATPTDSHSIPIITQPSSSKPQKKKSRRKQRKDSAPTEPTTKETTPKEHVSTPSYDLPSKWVESFNVCSLGAQEDDIQTGSRKIEVHDDDAEVTLRQRNGKNVEPDLVHLKKKDQVSLDEEMARNLEAQLQDETY
ncbi:hypothetical protein Tco_1476868 [Tanacetum coccineum]